jgi:hypothetical protein
MKNFKVNLKKERNQLGLLTRMLIVLWNLTVVLKKKNTGCWPLASLKSESNLENEKRNVDAKFSSCSFPLNTSWTYSPMTV